MRSRRSLLEAQKEKKIKNLLPESLDGFKLPRPRFINKDLEESFLFEKPSLPHGGESSAENSSRYQYNIISDTDVTYNIIAKEQEELFNTHRSYINAYTSLERRINQLELDANRQLLLNLRDDPFSYGKTEAFNTSDKVDLEKSTIEVLEGKAVLGFERYRTVPLKIRNVQTKVSCTNGVITNINELNSTSNIKEKDGSFFKVKVETNKPEAIVVLDILIELEEEMSIDKLQTVYKAINAQSKESISVSYSKDGSEYIRSEENELNTIGIHSSVSDLYDTDIKLINIRIQKRGADKSSNFINEYLYLIDYIGAIDYVYKSSGEYYSEALEITDLDGNPIDFSLASIETGTCCITPNETSVSFFLSKDGENYLPISYYGESNTVVEFKNNINTNIFSLENEVYGDIYRDTQNNYSRLNRYIPEGISFDKNTVQIKRGLGEWKQVGNYYECFIEINNIEGRYFNVFDKECFVNGSKKTGTFYLGKGRHKIKTHSDNYKIIDESTATNNLTALKRKDSLYPKNHKYIFEGFRYPGNFEGEKVYRGADNLYTSFLRKTNRNYFERSVAQDLFYIEVIPNYGSVFVVKQGTSDEEVYITCEYNDNDDDNKLYIKAILNSTNPNKSPKIDSIQVRVI